MFSLRMFAPADPAKGRAADVLNAAHLALCRRPPGELLVDSIRCVENRCRGWGRGQGRGRGRCRRFALLRGRGNLEVALFDNLWCEQLREYVHSAVQTGREAMEQGEQGKQGTLSCILARSGRSRKEWSWTHEPKSMSQTSAATSSSISNARCSSASSPASEDAATLAVGETVILLHPPLPFVGVSIWM